MALNQTTRMDGRTCRLAVLLGILCGGLLYAVETELDLIGTPGVRLRAHLREEVLVVLKGSDASFVSSVIDGRIISRYDAGRRTILRVKLPAGKSVEKAIAENWAGRDGRILRVEPNYQVCAMSVPDDNYFGHLWGLYNTGQTGGSANCDIQAPDAWNITTGSYEVVVAVIDTGVDISHPDLAGQKWTNAGEISNNGIDDDGNGYVDDIAGWDFCNNDKNPRDENGHGTHVAGTIAAQGNNGLGVAGVAWQCRIMPCRFLDASGSGSIADAIEAINYAVANGADILNNSWGGGGYSAAMKAAIENAESHGVLFVAAAGNTSQDNDTYGSYPANYAVDNVISVAATTSADELASFSCYGANSVHVAAPGVSILSTVPGGYGWMSGTSMATPHVSGAAALLMAANPGIELSELKTRLTWCGDRVPSLQNKTLTGCRLNVYSALTAQDCISVVEPAEGEHWVKGFHYNIKWIAIGAGETVSIFLEQAGQVVRTIAANAENSGCYRWLIPAGLENGSDYSIVVTDGAFESQSGLITIDDARTNYHTEWFSGRVCDLSNKSILFVPDGAGDYAALTYQISALPTSVTGSTLLTLGDDDARSVQLANPVLFYGTSYNRLFIGSNGYITFDRLDAEYRASRDNHFALKRLSVLFQDLDPTSGGRVCWKELGDRVAISWVNVARYSAPTAKSTFQAELFHDGRIRLSWLRLSSANPIVGFSQGSGISADYQDEDLSACDSYEPEVESIRLSGPASIFENTTTALSCTSSHAYGIERIATDRAAWSTDDPVASVDAGGVLSVGNVELFKHVNIGAELDGKTAMLGVCVKDRLVKNVTISNHSMTSGTASGYESMVLTGKLTVSSAAVGSCDAIVVKLWNAENTCVYSATFDKIRRFFVNNVYSRTIKSGIQSQVLRLEPLRRSVSLGIINVELSGESQPAYFTIECGDYKGLGILN